MGKCAKGAAFKCPSAKLYKFSFLSYVYTNLVHKLKCETNLTLLSTSSRIYLS